MDFKPEPLPEMYLINDLDQLKALTDPLHQRLIEILSQKAMTVTQVANLMGEKPNRLYYHINKLEEVGLVQIVETCPYFGILEKYYQSVAGNFKIDESVLQFQGEELRTLYDLTQGVFEATMAELREVRTYIRLPREKVNEAYEKVQALEVV